MAKTKKDGAPAKPAEPVNTDPRPEPPKVPEEVLFGIRNAPTADLQAMREQLASATEEGDALVLAAVEKELFQVRGFRRPEPVEAPAEQ